jgi:hypothetical protein
MRVLARRTPTGLVPADEQAQNELRRVPIGKHVYVEIVAARNPRQHRLLFALLGIIVEACDYPSTEAALTALKIATGHVEQFSEKNGAVHFVVKSISFANMKQSDWEPWFDGALKVVSDRWLLGIKDAELRKQIEEMVGP